MAVISKCLRKGSETAAYVADQAAGQISRWLEPNELPDPGNLFLRRYGPWALVTGAARAEGVGYGFARRLAGRNFSLVLVDNRGPDLERRAAELRARYDVKVRPVVLDLGEPDFAEALQAQTSDIEVGLLVCNHMATPADTPPILEMDLATLHAMLDINARAYTTLIHTYGRQMAARGRGGMVVVSSGAGLMPTPYTGAYSANKAYQIALGEALWYELQSRGVDVTVAVLGLTNTQGDALAGYPQFMVAEVDPTVVEILDNLGKSPQVIPGTVNKLFLAAQTRLMPRRMALQTIGEFMARGLGKDKQPEPVSRPEIAAPIA